MDFSTKELQRLTTAMQRHLDYLDQQSSIEKQSANPTAYIAVEAEAVEVLRLLQRLNNELITRHRASKEG